MQVNRVATMQVETARPDETVYEVADQMNIGQIGFLPVVDNDQKPIGVITDRDIVMRVVAERRNPNITYARDVMSQSVHWIYEDAEIEDAARLMSHKALRRLLVNNHEGAVVGVLSLDDLALFASGDRTTAQVLERAAETTVAGARMPAAFEL